MLVLIHPSSEAVKPLNIVPSSNENIAEAISKGIEAGLKHKNDIAYDLLFNSQESNIESYGIDRDVDISQFDLNKNELDFLNRSTDKHVHLYNHVRKDFRKKYKGIS